MGDNVYFVLGMIVIAFISYIAGGMLKEKFLGSNQNDENVVQTIFTIIIGFVFLIVIAYLFNTSGCIDNTYDEAFPR